MNKTEAEFAMMLEARRRQGEIQRYEFEAITLRWGQGDMMMAYTPDFHCTERVQVLQTEAGKSITLTQTVFREVKGGHIFQKDLVKFKAAATHFAKLFSFELWQKKAGEWKQLI